MQLNSSGGLYHDACVYLACRAAQSLGYQYEVEDKAYEDLTKHPFRPDAVFTYKGRDQTRKTKVFLEVQKEISVGWLTKMGEQYDGKDYIIVPLQRIAVKYSRDPKRFMERVYECVYGYVDAGTEKLKEKKSPHNLRIGVKKPKKEDKIKAQCSWCAKYFIGLKVHRYRCPKKPPGEP